MHGNPSKLPAARLDRAELTFPVKLPTCPRHLSKEARREYRRLGRILLERGTIAEVDRGSLAMLASSWATHVEAETALAALTPEEMADPGTGRHKILLRISYKAMQHVLTLSKAFGLTPASRGSVSPGSPPPPQGGSAWGQFAGKGA